MKRRTLFFAPLFLGLTGFGAAGWYVKSSQSKAEGPSELPASDVLVRSYSPVLGNPEAPITIVEFFDPACEACRAFHPLVKQTLARYENQVRVVLRYTPFHGEGSERAIAALEAARMQGVFEPVLNALLARQPEWAAHGQLKPDLIPLIAAEAGLDQEKARDQMRAPQVIAVINQDRADVEAVGVDQTPTFFVNGAPLPEFGAEPFIQMVDQAVADLSNGA